MRSTKTTFIAESSRPSDSTIRRFSGIAGSIILVAALAACSNTASPPAEGDGDELTTVRLAIVPSTPWLTAMVAEDQGFFEENGLDVEITKVQQSPSAALGQQFDIGSATGTDFVQAVNGGLDQVVISNVAQEGEDTTALMVAGDSDIDSIGGVAGQRVGVATTASAIAQSVKFLLAEDGGDPDSVQLQEMPFPTMPDQIASGQIEVIAPVAPFVGQAEGLGARSLLNPVLAAGQAVLGDDAAVPVLFASSTREWAESHPEAVAAWRAALTQAAEYIAENEDDARRILQEFTELPEAVAQQTPLFSYESDAVEPDEIAAWIEILEGAGTLSVDLDPADLVVD